MHKIEQLYLSPSSSKQVIDNQDVFGFLASPRTGVRQQIKDGAWWAMDNDAFNNGGNVDVEQWMSVLNAHKPYIARCLFVVVPDVPFDAVRTLKQFPRYASMLEGWSLAIATQNGMKPHQVPWDSVDCLFVGGDNKHKLGPGGGALIAEARRRGKWIHIGRVNSRERLLKFSVADSWDGTTISREPARAVKIAQTVREIRALKQNGGFQW